MKRVLTIAWLIGVSSGWTQNADFDGSGQVDFDDFFLFADAFGGTDSRFDLDGNGMVDFGDFFLFADTFGRTVEPAPEPKPNHPPMADAGLEQMVTVGEKVPLDGRGSSDADGDELTYRWTAPAGIVLSSGTVVRPTFTATATGRYQFVLVVNDGQVDSVPDTVGVTVIQPNRAPMAYAGVDQHVQAGATVQLDGSASYDPDGDALSFTWREDSSNPETGLVSDVFSNKPTVAISTVGVYRFSLVVSDRQAESTPDTMQIWVQKVERIAVGTQADFLNITPGNSLLSATCRYVGVHCYIFVEDAQWDAYGGFINQTDVDTLGELFDQASPMDPARGIYDLEVENFGSPPDTDGDERIFIVLLDSGDPQIIGFFDPSVSIWSDPALRRDTIYLDSWTVRRRQYLAQGTLAHIFHYLIHWGYDEDEDFWVTRGLAGYAEKLIGYPEGDADMVPAFLERPDFDLTSWENSAASYGATYLFIAFLAERYGSEFLRSLVAEPHNGTFGIDAAFQAIDRMQNFDGSWAQWIVGNYAPDDPQYGYSALQGRRVITFSTPPLPFENSAGIVYHTWGTTYILFRTPGNIEVEFAGEEVARFKLWGYLMRGETGEAVEIELDDQNRGLIQAVNIDSLALIVGKTSLTGGSFYISAREISLPSLTE